MKNDLLRMIEQELKTGYRLDVVRGGIYGVRDPHGEWVKRTGTSEPYEIRSLSNTPHTKRRVLSTLRAAGAVRPTQRKSSHPYKPRPEAVEVSMYVTATEILKDVHATPRERRLAREYLRLWEQEAKVRGLLREAISRLK